MHRKRLRELRYKWAVAFITAMLFPKHVHLSATLKPPPQSLGPEPGSRDVIVHRTAACWPAGSSMNLVQYNARSLGPLLSCLDLRTLHHRTHSL